MKYYSEILKKYYDSAEECEKAEQEQKAKDEKNTNEKKQLAKAIEEASSLADAAMEKYEIAKKEANDRVTKAREEAIKYLEPFKAEVESTQKNRYNAISEFNSKYGNYTKVYTGSDAYKQMVKAIQDINNIFNLFN